MLRPQILIYISSFGKLNFNIPSYTMFQSSDPSTKHCGIQSNIMLLLGTLWILLWKNIFTHQLFTWDMLVLRNPTRLSEFCFRKIFLDRFYISRVDYTIFIPSFPSLYTVNTLNFCQIFNYSSSCMYKLYLGEYNFRDASLRSVLGITSDKLPFVC